MFSSCGCPRLKTPVTHPSGVAASFLGSFPDLRLRGPVSISLRRLLRKPEGREKGKGGGEGGELGEQDSKE